VRSWRESRFAGDELASIAKRGARHLNREHGDSFHTMQFDTISAAVTRSTARVGGHAHPAVRHRVSMCWTDRRG